MAMTAAICDEPITFQFEGLRIDSLVLERRTEPDGATTFLIRSSNGLRLEDNCHTFGLGVPISNEALQGAQRWFAEQFARKLRGISAPAVLPLVRISNPVASGNCVRTVAAVDLDTSVTLLSPALITALNLQPSRVAEMRPHGLKVQSFQVRIKFGDKELDIVCASSGRTGGAMCVLGKDFCESLRGLDWRLYHRLVDDNIEKAYRYGAIARENGVLIIGSFRPDNRELLSKVGAVLFEYGYRGVMLDEFQDISDNSLEQKLMFLSSITKFVICIDNAPAGHYVELSICARFGVITALLTDNQAGRESSAMLYDLHIQNRFMKAFSFAPTNIDAAVGQAIGWATEASAEKARLYNGAYAEWRRTPPAQI